MPVSAETLALLMEKGLAGNDLLQVVRAIDADGADAQPIRSARQDRNARYYRNRKIREASENVLIKTSEQDAKGVAASPKEITQTPTTTPKDSDRREDAKSILGSILADETVVDLMAHRKAIRSPITPGAAKGLAKAFVDYGDPERAARAMMANGWRGFKPEWMTSQQPSTANARAGPASHVTRTNHYYDGLTGREPYEHLQHGHGAGGSEQPADQAFGDLANGHATLEAVRAPGRREDVFDIPELGALGGSARRFG